ncbi:hypothetical protein QTP88_013224 [Uroleucon formosanum]
MAKSRLRTIFLIDKPKVQNLHLKTTLNVKDLNIEEPQKRTYRIYNNIMLLKLFFISFYESTSINCSVF